MTSGADAAARSDAELANAVGLEQREARIENGTRTRDLTCRRAVWPASATPWVNEKACSP
jgi:hypothetical protein